MPVEALPRRRIQKGRASVYALHKMRTRGCRLEPIGEILRFVGHLSVAKLHDAHRVGRYVRHR